MLMFMHNWHREPVSFVYVVYRKQLLVSYAGRLFGLVRGGAVGYMRKHLLLASTKTSRTQKQGETVCRHFPLSSATAQLVCPQHECPGVCQQVHALARLRPVPR